MFMCDVLRLHTCRPDEEGRGRCVQRQQQQQQQQRGARLGRVPVSVGGARPASHVRKPPSDATAQAAAESQSLVTDKVASLTSARLEHLRAIQWDTFS